MTTTDNDILLITADGVCDADLSVAGRLAHPAAILLERAGQNLRVLAVGSLGEAQAHPAARGAQRLDRPGSVLLPALVNAHTHLDLSHIGPRPHDQGDGFVAWVDHIRAERRQGDADIADAVRLGVELLRRGGVAAVGDIAGAPAGLPTLTPGRTLAESGLAGVSYLEFFAIGKSEPASLDRLRSTLDSARAPRVNEGATESHARLGLQPHATNTVSPRAYREAVRFARELDLPLMTHLAETPEEREFIASASGPQREFLERLGLWTDGLDHTFGRGLSPVAHLEDVLRESPMTAVHVNQCSDDDLRILAETGTSVVYCPRASAYFGAENHFGPHRYRDMLAAGVPVALGTDSVINLPGAEVNAGGLGPLDEARFLFRRDGTDPVSLLRMATVNGARIIGLDESLFRLSPGSSPLAIIEVPLDDSRSGHDPLAGVLKSYASPRFVLSSRGDA